MGIRGRFVLVTILIALAVGGSSFYILEKSNEELLEMNAVRIADIVSSQVAADRAAYTADIVGKLKAEGTGASVHSAEEEGFIQLPAQFVLNVSNRVAEKAGDLYSYSLLSGWNINPEQGMDDDFEQWAWERLLEQDEAFRAQGPPPEGGYPWKSVYRFETINGGPVLRYMSADPASAEACVTCHNKWELKPEMMAVREKAGVAPGKQWELHELMGGLRVDVPVNEVAAAASHARNVMLASLGGVFAGGFVLLFGLIQRTVIRPVENSVRDVEGFAKDVDSVVGCSRDLVISADSQGRACKEALSDLEAEQVSQEGIRTSLGKLAGAANENAMKAEESAVYCNQLEESFTGLRGRLQEMISGAAKDDR